MPLTKLRRPKSTLSSIKQKLFSPYISQKRLHDIQEVCRNEEIDCILIVQGIDSRFNKGCSELSSYLLFDMLETRQDDIERSGVDEDIFEDLMLCVHPNYVDVYCNPVNYWLLVPYIVHWPGLRLHCLPEIEYYEDADKAEEYKISVLLRMVENCPKIGIPFSSRRENLKTIKFDKMMIEQWPVIQASALEDISGGRGFFTLTHSVVDVSEQVHDMLNEFDPIFMESMYNNILPSFENQFENVFQILDSHRADTEVWNSKRFVGPLLSYFEHGCAVMNKCETKSDFHPLVLFGRTTEKRTLRMLMEGLPAEVSHLEETPTHVVIQGAVPRQPDLVCARTYFLEGTSDLDWYNVSAEGDSNRIRSNRENTKTLFETYTELVRGCEKAIDYLRDGKSEKEASSLVAEFVRNSTGQNARNIEIRIGTSAVKANQKTALYHIQGVVFNVTNKSGDNLGSVLFGDTIALSTLSFISNEKLITEGSATRITFGIPRFLLWTGERLDAIRKFTNEEYGAPIVMDNTEIVLESENGLLMNVSCVFYEKHLLLHHKRHGHSLVPLNRLEYYEGESIGDPSIVIVPCSAGDRNVSMHLTLNNQLTLVVETKTRFKSALYSKLIPLWKQSQILDWLDKVPESLRSTYRFLQSRNSSSRSPQSGGLDKALYRQPDLSHFLKHLEVACCLKRRQCPTRQELSTLLDEEEDVTNESASSDSATPGLVLTVVCGLPGSYKEQLCSCVTRLVKDETRWMVLRPPSLEALMDLKERLSGGGAMRRPLPGQGRKQVRGLLCCPRFVGASHVAKLVASISSAKIGAVTVCVDPSAAFVENRLTFPVLLDQCANGWANNIVFTSPGISEKSQELEDLQLMLRSLNPHVTTFYAPRGEVTRTEELDVILSEEAFSQPGLVRARNLGSHGFSYPDSQFTIYPRLEEHKITFNRPLVRGSMMKRLRELKKNLKPWPYSGNIYFVQGRLTFAKEKGQMLEFWHHALSGTTWSQMLEALPTPPGAAPVLNHCQVTFVGVDLKEETLKNWLRAAAPQRPEKKSRRTRKDLSQKELDRIHKDKHLSPLPSGWFYNGIQFMNMDGEKFDKHPEFPIHVQEYLDEENIKIDVFNAEIESQQYFDLFDD